MKKKVYVVRPAMYFVKKYLQENSRDIQGAVLMIVIWAAGFITGGALMFLKLKGVI